VGLRGIRFAKTKGGMEGMKIVSLCGGCSKCPVVKITDKEVEIGEKGNTCVLTREQWETLKEKILEKEL
jgi:uncharacterized cysteine cluster protein YcgN (CxxCxxCC family)